MIVFSHPTGNQNARHAALGLLEEKLLAQFWTSISWDDGSIFDRALPTAIRRELQRRSFPEELKPLMRMRPWRELGRLLSSRLKLGSLHDTELAPFSIDAVYRAMDRYVARRVLPRTHSAAVYAYEDAALETFRIGRQIGRHCFYELPIGYWRAARLILSEEREREPEWASTLRGTADSTEKLERKDEELGLASTIIVPSTFTKETLELAPDIAASVHVNPYGAPPVAAQSVLAKTDGKLKVLFVGALGQRKGLSYLLKAIESLGNCVELTVIGRKQSETCEPLNRATRKHRWIPTLPHSELLLEMRRHDVFVFPSLFEGFALVILEAMSQGLPVITTPNSGGLDVISSGHDGFSVPIRSATAIAEKLVVLAEDRALLLEMKAAAVETARRCSWKDYRMRLVDVVRQAMCCSKESPPRCKDTSSGARHDA